MAATTAYTFNLAYGKASEKSYYFEHRSERFSHYRKTGSYCHLKITDCFTDDYYKLMVKMDSIYQMNATVKLKTLINPTNAICSLVMKKDEENVLIENMFLFTLNQRDEYEVFSFYRMGEGLLHLKAVKSNVQAVYIDGLIKFKNFMMEEIFFYDVGGINVNSPIP